MKRWAILLLLLNGCVSIGTYNRNLENEYHRGRIEIIWKVAGWMDSGEMDLKDLRHLVGGLKSGEFIWSCTSLGEEAKHLRWQYDLTHEEKNQ